MLNTNAGSAFFALAGFEGFETSEASVSEAEKEGSESLSSALVKPKLSVSALSGVLTLGGGGGGGVAARGFLLLLEV